MMDLNRTFIEAKSDQNKDKDLSCTKNILDKIIKDRAAFEEVSILNGSLTDVKNAKAMSFSYKSFLKKLGSGFMDQHKKQGIYEESGVAVRERMAKHDEILGGVIENFKNISIANKLAKQSKPGVNISFFETKIGTKDDLDKTIQMQF